MNYHVVCHDCEAEKIDNSKHAAHDLAEQHADTNSHTVEVKEVAE